ncbi:MAG: hypothetical protein AMXMBFR49_30240 [Chlorobiota bacterium]|nr:MAG: cation:proton antiporter [Chlorobiota bacterium]
MFLEFAIDFSLAVLGLTILLAIVRLVKGPHTADRVVAADLTTSVAIAFIAIYSIRTGETWILDVGLILGFAGFLGTVGYAYYLQLRGKK